MGLFNLFDPIAAAVLGGNNNAPKKAQPYVQPRPVPIHLGFAKANPDWNAATAPIAAASTHGWSANSLQSYLQTFQNLGGPVSKDHPIATDQSLFQPAGKPLTMEQAQQDPAKLLAEQTEAPGSANVIPSLVANSVGGAMSPAAASLYGRMLGAAPPAATAAAKASAVVPSMNPSDRPRPGTPGAYNANGTLNPMYGQAFKAGQQSLYSGMTPVQKQQANAIYNVSQPVPKLG